MGGFLAAPIVEMVLWNEIPDWLTDRPSYGVGLPVGELIARILIKLMKLKE